MPWRQPHGLPSGTRSTNGVTNTMVCPQMTTTTGPKHLFVSIPFLINVLQFDGNNHIRNNHESKKLLTKPPIPLAWHFLQASCRRQWVGEAVVWETVANAHELDPQCPRSDICSTQGLCRPVIVKQLGVCCLWPIKTTMASANQNNNGPHGETVTSPRKSPHHLNLHPNTKPTTCCHQKRPRCLQLETLASVASRRTAPPQPPFQHVAHSLLSPKTTQASLVGKLWHQ